MRTKIQIPPQIVFIFASVLISIGTSGCGSAKEPMRKSTPILEEEDGATRKLGPENLKDVRRGFDLYAPSGGLTAEQIDRLLNRYSPEMRDYVSSVLKNQKKKSYTFDDLMALLEKDCVVFEWMKKGPVGDTASLKATLSKVYPDAHRELVERLGFVVAGAKREPHSDSVEIPPESLIKSGVIVGRVKHAGARDKLRVLSDQLIAKQIWISTPDLPIGSLNAADREIALFIAGLSLTSLSSKETDSKPTPVRSAHVRYFGALAQQVDGAVSSELDLSAFEDLDWRLNDLIANQVLDERDPHFAFAFPRVAAAWNPSKGPLSVRKSDELVVDLFIAGATDQVMGFCEMRADRSLSKEFLQVFLGRISLEKFADGASEEEKCARFQRAFHPDAMTYGWWKLKLAFSIGGARP